MQSILVRLRERSALKWRSASQRLRNARPMVPSTTLATPWRVMGLPRIVLRVMVSIGQLVVFCAAIENCIRVSTTRRPQRSNFQGLMPSL